jgi:hypothetical protein
MTTKQGSGAQGDAEIKSVTVAVVGIAGAPQIERCLQALAAQVDAPAFDTFVVYDPNLLDIPELKARYPHIPMIANEGQRSPMELAAKAVQLATGDLVILTEDHCVPRPNWVRALYEAQGPGRGAVGGRVETDADVPPVDWAFYLVDFFRYMGPVKRGPTPTLTVCNVSYRRAYLDQIRPFWSTLFHETAINDALRERFGPLWMEPAAEVRMRRNVSYNDAVYERYAFGRLFGCTRLQFCSALKRLYYCVFAPALPLLLMWRMGRKSSEVAHTRAKYISALGPLLAMVFAWSWGEWLGYLTKRRPESLVVAPEIRERARAAGLVAR